MPLLTTPSDLTRRSALFYQLAQMTTAGVGLIQALEVLHHNPPAAWMRRPFAALLSQLHAGASFSDSLAASGRWLSSFDMALLRAGEQSGRLPECFRLLANYYAGQAQLVRQVMAFTIYPEVVFHLAVLIFPIGALTDLILKGAVAPYLFQKLVVLGSIYGLALLLWYALQSTHGRAWQAALEGVLARVPGLGTARRQLAVARLSIALEALLNAGVTVIEAWDLASAASGSPALERAVRQSRPHLLAGTTPGEMVAARHEFPRTFATLYQTGEMTGQLDDTLRRTYTIFHEEGSRKLKVFVFAAAGALVGLVMLGVAWQVIRFYLGYFQQVSDAINMAP